MKFQNEAVPPPPLSDTHATEENGDTTEKSSSTHDRRGPPVMLKQDEDDLKPRLLINHINVIVTYPHPRIPQGDPIFAEIILKDSLTGWSHFRFFEFMCDIFLPDKSVPLDRKWKLDMKIDRPDGSCVTTSCKTDPETDLIYGSLESTVIGSVSDRSHISLFS
jgi:hypothetical protein